MPTNVYNRCKQCDRLLPDTLICPVCSSELVQLRTEQVNTRAALLLLVDRVKEIRGYWTESLDNAMMNAELVLRSTTTRPPSHIKIEPKAGQCPFCKLLHDPTKTNCNDPQTGEMIRRAGPINPLRLHAVLMAEPPSLTCTQFLEHAKNSMDAALDELIAANKLASGLASLLLLDMIENTGVMRARIHRILHELRSDEQKQALEKASNEAEHHGINPQSVHPKPMIAPGCGGKGDKRNLTELHPATGTRGRIVRDEATGETFRCCYSCGRPQDEHTGDQCPNP